MEKRQTYTFYTRSVEETQALAEKLGKRVEPGDVFTLSGDLGAGKTSFTQGLARGMGIEGVVNSPTFTIIKEYIGRFPLYHMDVYRIEDEAEDLGLDEYFYGDGVTVIEWPQMIAEQLPEERCEIVIKRGAEDERTLIFTPIGSRYQILCEAIKHDDSGD
ncbi:tRNA (adenosine(37)-N6)-threonylcarbamoyltransferase complex ATPase subunit type 1 TsaE [Aneurinibacillus thermoaerophilus]|uniref:tRNA (adenosine(37)-N6)-threonylcarbamoyltransferase complex ATPase subunit type 1 TsaE n=1 Tax=Aneurinibacillus thermoaerophilus TaxID=143495 RepID=UPI002E1D5E93|nr:tRNA (adenosine(37)-N6)-threonylcarbamoyltransferase complex ATPase subunit type 1 TsaE [Aneurinibacillus thermoaerophilus]MED0680967.1 tRNA (adenosine(37)-N6)-threonylcarbamoyltransferase complex ATPase subunit type 1 TsaE [Aneurinibacillus thermoaerophilus]MED0738618.1 tRNA (adenosine(37)-N6)-threonylcarbamoyltransferase complex ATPase subunit type 1 TsaE [Aneurinibacillus thermoaerophilus]MED0762968.1 tRNA (adenosine(37)-N6)-threonylcarbamoyltransferase complex ATPase subunit type 1 TsaE [